MGLLEHTKRLSDQAWRHKDHPLGSLELQRNVSTCPPCWQLGPPPLPYVPMSCHLPSRDELPCVRDDHAVDHVAVTQVWPLEWLVHPSQNLGCV